MKKLLLIVITSVILLSLPNQSFAHFLATDGNIGAVLHVEPNDDPVAGSQASFFFAFKDKENKFTPQQCECTFEINENGNNIFSQPLFQNNSNPSLSNASVFFTFPKRDVYQVKVVGKPLTPNAFQPFTLTWNFRVDQLATSEDTNSQSNGNFLSTHFVYIVGIVILLFGFFIYIIRTLANNKQTAKGGGKNNDKKDTSNQY